MRERARVPRGVLRRAEARRGAGERQLPLRRRRARVPPRQLRRRRARVPRRLRADRRRGARDTARRAPARASCSRSSTPAHTSSSTAPPTTPPRSPRRPEAPADQRAVGRRPRLPLHRRHHRQPQGRDVALRRPVRLAVADGAARVGTARRGDRDARRQARRNVPARVPAHARHRPVHRAVDARRRRHGRAPRHAAPRRRRGVGRGRARTRAGVHDRGRRVRPPAARRARRRTEPLGPLGPARDHVVGRHVEPGDQARAARASPPRDADRLARRVGRHHDAHRDTRGRRHRAGAVQGQRTGRGRHRRRRARASPATK